LSFRVRDVCARVKERVRECCSYAGAHLLGQVNSRLWKEPCYAIFQKVIVLTIQQRLWYNTRSTVYYYLDQEGFRGSTRYFDQSWLISDFRFIVRLIHSRLPTSNMVDGFYEMTTWTYFWWVTLSTSVYLFVSSTVVVKVFRVPLILLFNILYIRPFVYYLRWGTVNNFKICLTQFNVFWYWRRSGETETYTYIIS